MDVQIILGSASDIIVAKKAVDVLKEFGVEYNVTVASAHRTPDRVEQIIKEAHEKGVKVFIAIAGLAAHLPGVIASKTVKPVIGVPVDSNLNGMDALLSIAQMPPGIPVACVGIGRGDNAALLACEIIGAGDEKMREKLLRYRAKMAEKVEQDAKALGL
ncbi:MAG: 5-(carboxyamino)imidazole ribonucleotide mutase [Euryarchaeota archaeon]|nr:5-(carboxyamino)imidazole ribonucleotide mutase [Euryarchaeota archaeon]MBU4339507.1 5-(carboxyamino)imidazole ribonucleotide mutase [Euryarchaeota archaeon]MBU4453976.1 5-(carboxyamino)imidazole ribonucleotide mutase [Euryarchaeota archaeon]MCG2736960.1 5-(carboxyamino)imidazole ribonucleotide mutase [Candidatus Methanoperedenaceae archaeon]